jgi:hypothetical protein
LHQQAVDEDVKEIGAAHLSSPSIITVTSPIMTVR